MVLAQPTQPRREMKVLALGLPRTGSMSIAAALTKLGYQNVYHASNAIDRDIDWKLLNVASDATFPWLPSHIPGYKLNKDFWDQLYASCEATTDAGSVFAESMIESYPNAKVLLVERDFDKWEKSVFDGLFPLIWSPMANFHIHVVEKLASYEGGMATRKMVTGIFGVADHKDARPKAREAFDAHYKLIKDKVPAEKLLIYRLGQGWGPLCEFLDKPVPKDEDGKEAEFPWLNEKDMLQGIAMKRMRRNVFWALMALFPYFVGALGVGAGIWLAAHQQPRPRPIVYHDNF